MISAFTKTIPNSIPMTVYLSKEKMVSFFAE
jgi:hypothetical protein